MHECQGRHWAHDYAADVSEGASSPGQLDAVPRPHHGPALTGGEATPESIRTLMGQLRQWEADEIVSATDDDRGRIRMYAARQRLCRSYRRLSSTMALEDLDSS